MKKHVKVYLDYYGYGEQDVIICECGCGGIANQIHHLVPRGMGGSKIRDNIENLIALTMVCHDKAESDKKFNNKLKLIKKREFNGKRD
jgi:5-methylcytosine-specific restriction endonuclease McrA